MRGVRLACVKPAASVRSEPGSNSQVETPERVLDVEPCTSVTCCLQQVIIRSSFYRSSPTNSEADTWIIAFATRPICKSLDRMTTEPPAYLFRYPSMSKSKRTKITITTSTRRHNRHPIPRMSPDPTALPSTAFPAPPAFPPSVKRCLGLAAGGRKQVL